MTIVRLDRITKEFATGNLKSRGLASVRSETDSPAALMDVSLQAKSGELLVVVGPSGSGKTTFLRLLAGLDTPTSGQIWFDDREVTCESSWRREVALVADSAALLPHLTVAENLVWSRENRGRRQEDKDQLEWWVERLGLNALLGRYPQALSAGQQQRVALGRALLASPRVMLLDEPLSRLEASLRLDLARTLRQIHRESGQTWVYVTHDRQEALLVADRIAVLDQGRLLQVGTARDLLDHPRHVRVAAWSWEYGGTRLRSRHKAVEAWWRPEDVRVERVTDATDGDQGRMWLSGRVASVVERGAGAVWIWVELAGEQASGERFVSSTVLGAGHIVAVAGGGSPENETENKLETKNETGGGEVGCVDRWQLGEQVRVGFDWDRASWFDSVSGWLLTVGEEDNA